MRTQRWMSITSLLAVLALPACRDDDGDAAVGSSDGISPTVGQERAPGPGDGGQSSGSPSAQERTTTVDDTAPHRPGTPSPP